MLTELKVSPTKPIRNRKSITAKETLDELDLENIPPESETHLMAKIDESDFRSPERTSNTAEPMAITLQTEHPNESPKTRFPKKNYSPSFDPKTGGGGPNEIYTY